jgi:DNA modification methylase
MEIKSKQIELVATSLLQYHPKNMHVHSDEQIERLCELIKYQGWRNPIIVQKGTNLVVAGNGRLMAAKKLGIEKVPVIEQEFDSEAQLYSYIVSDNAIGKDTWATLDLAQINLDLIDFGSEINIDMLGLKDFVIESPEVFEAQSGEDDVPDVVHPITRRGDIWLLGNHRLMCGDSTMIDDVEKLMNGEKPDLIHTDPPYGMNAVSKSAVLKKNYGTDIHGDDNSDIAKQAFSLIYGLYPEAKQIWWGANYYCSALPDSECWLVWDKNNGQSDQTDCELAWANFRSVVRQFTQSSEKTNRVHPTQKPVSLTEWIMHRFKVTAKSVADFFGGSGSTLIAAEKNGINCFCMEYDEKFVDVIIKRWEKYTGKKATLELTGQTYEELKAERDLTQPQKQN